MPEDKSESPKFFLMEFSGTEWEKSNELHSSRVSVLAEHLDDCHYIQVSVPTAKKLKEALDVMSDDMRLYDSFSGKSLVMCIENAIHVSFDGLDSRDI